ncbi:MAG: hypothetical protein SchgKO_13210 [Schleiferiaceae bacterium]
MSLENRPKEYSNGEVTIIWKSDVCIHAANCVKGLPGVFDTKKRPWINAQGASTQEIIDQVNKCPSGALTYKMDSDVEASAETTVDVTLASNGPLLVAGKIRVFDAEGNLVEEKEKCALCRCGESSNKPYCDGSHKAAGFVG